VRVGNVVTYTDGFANWQTVLYRAGDGQPHGGFMIAEVARLLKGRKEKLPSVLYVVNAVQRKSGCGVPN
jgi:hypothetical protein